MSETLLEQLGSYSNFVLLGEGGCGKSELAINLARYLLPLGKDVHLFDMDMTKPLFRTREQAAELEKLGVQVHFEQQFADAPTQVGGVSLRLRDSGCCAILDVGGDHIGARAIGGYAPLINGPDTAVLYLINPFRAWSDTAEHAGFTLSQILGVSHIRPEKVQFVGSPWLGEDTAADDVTEGLARLQEMVEHVAFLCVEEGLCAQLSLPVPVLPIRRQIVYPW